MNQLRLCLREGESMAAIILNVVVLPQPFGPKMLTTLPFSTVKSNESTAQNGSFFIAK